MVTVLAKLPPGPPPVRTLLLLSLLSACTPAAGTGVPLDEGESTSPADSDADTAGPDDGQDDDSATPEPDDTGHEDDDPDVIPGSIGTPAASPPGGAFVDALTVQLTSDRDDGVLLACVADPDRSCELEPSDGSLTLRGSGVVHARVDVGGIAGAPLAWTFVEVSEDVADFSSNLPVMIAWTAQPRPNLEANTPVGLAVFEPDGDRTALVAATSSGRARLRIRGSSSASLDKKNYDLELWAADSEDDRPEPLLGLPEDADWVLHAPSYWDDALIRNALGYALSNDIGRYAPRTRFFELFLADGSGTVSLSDYAGLYVLVEEIERGSDRVDVARLGPEDTEGTAVTGGYVFKRDRSDESDTEIWAGEAGGAFRFSVPIVPVDPESDKLADEQVDYLWDELDSFARALAATDGVDPTTGRPFEDIADLESFIDLHILNVLFKNPDAFRLSAYYHKDREGPVVAGPLWDLDRTAGSRDARALDPLHWDASNETTDTTPVFTYGWQGGLFAHEAVRAAYFARWQELLAGPLSNASIQARIDAMAAELAEAGPRNEARWGSRDFEGEVDGVRTWFAARTAWIDACITTTSDPRDCAGEEILDESR